MANSTLQAANGSSIAVYGTRSLSLNFGFGRIFQWTFHIASVRHPILGADFLSHYGLTVDCKHGRLLDSTYHQINRIDCVSGTESMSLLSDLSPSSQLQTSEVIAQILSEYPTLTQAFSCRAVKHEVEHCIQVTGPPVFARARRLSPDQLRIAKREFDNMLELGIIRPSDRPYASPLHMVVVIGCRIARCAGNKAP